MTKRTKKGSAADWSATLKTTAGVAEAPVAECTLSVRVPLNVRQGLARLAVERTAAGPYRVTIQALVLEACQALLKKHAGGKQPIA